MAQKIGNKIKQLRKARNLSQEALAQILGVSFQAVSKWETHATTPDISLIPAIASYFKISIDELFDYNTWENERIIDGIMRRGYALRYDDPAAAEVLIQEGLKQFPANENLLTLLVYILWALPGREEDLIATCKTLIECATNQGVKCDVLRFLAMAYRRTGQNHLIPEVLEQIPEFYFTKLECVAKLTEGETSLRAARFQMNTSGKSTVEMLRIMAAQHPDEETRTRCHRLAEGILDVFRRENGYTLENPGYEWIDEI